MKNLLKIISELFLKIVFKKKKRTHNLFSKFISTSRKILIMADETVTDKSIITEIIKYFTELEKHVSILLPSNMMSSFLNFPKIEFITYNPVDINFLGFPKKNITEILSEKKIDVIIDLSIKENFFNNYINKFLQADFSIGFERSNSDTYYNFQLKPETNSEKSYRNLLNSLKMF